MNRFKVLALVLSIIVISAMMNVAIIFMNSKVYSGQDLMHINPALNIIPTTSYVFTGRLSEEWFGMTLGNVVLVFEDKEAVEEVVLQYPDCIIHEDEHVKQYAALGFFRFLKNYLSFYAYNRYVLKQNAEDAYNNIPYEQEAVDRQDSEC
jgi:hypothetical protein